MAPAPPIVYDDLEKYQKTEGVTSAVVFVITLLLLILFSVALCRRQYLKLSNRKLVHSLLSLIYTNLISIKKNQNKDEEVYLFGGKEFNYDENMWSDSDDTSPSNNSSNSDTSSSGTNGTNNSSNSNTSSNNTDSSNKCSPSNVYKVCCEFRFYCKSCCCHCWTYAYFLIMALIAIFWLITITIENAVYRKTGTCNDINVQDNRFTCFDIDNEDKIMTDCRSVSLNTNVFCYQLDIRPSAIGIGFSLFALIIFVTTTAFKATIKVAEYGGCRCKWTFLITQVVIALAAVIAIIVIPPPLHYKEVISIYFFYGDAVMRWIMYFLLIITVSCGFLVPWCGFTSEDKYKEVVGKKKNEEQLVGEEPKPTPVGEEPEPTEKPEPTPAAGEEPEPTPAGEEPEPAPVGEEPEPTPAAGEESEPTPTCGCC